ncbi:hypothetical protein F4775DRAFT_608266 [Biscogniauxia sp. FL1348]|nr:hypothetical protein F4775DRAFT_608266 [Biscogniauxia sp. FL1348]
MASGGCLYLSTTSAVSDRITNEHITMTRGDLGPGQTMKNTLACGSPPMMHSRGHPEKLDQYHARIEVSGPRRRDTKRIIKRTDRKENTVMITRSIAIDHHQIEAVNGIVTRSIIDADTPEDTDQRREAVAHRLGSGTYLRVLRVQKSPDHREVLTCAVTGELLRLNVQNPLTDTTRHTNMGIRKNVKAYFRGRRTRPPEHNEERDDSFDIRRRTGLPSLDPIRHDPPVVDLPVYDVKIEPASLDNEIVVELAELDDLPNHDLPRDNRSEAEPLIKNDDNTDLQSSENEIRVIVLSDHDDDEPEEIVVELSEHQDDNPDEAPDQPTTTPQEPRDNPPSPSPPPSLSFSSSSSSSFSPPSPSPSTTATEYTTGGPSPWDDLPAPSQRLLARYAIPRDASFAHWDGASRPFAVWSSVFDARALGDWIYGWAAATHQDLAAVARFRATLARLARNVATATEAQTQIGPRLRDGADLLDEVEALVRVCQGPMVGPRERERYCARRPGADDGRIPVLGPGAARAFVDTLLGRADFWLVEEAARAWNGWFARWWHRGGGGDEEYEVFLEARERL